MPRKFGDGDIVARQQFFHRLRRNAHAEHRRAVAQAQKDRAGIGAEFQRLVDAEQHAGAVGFLSHQQRVAVDHIGAGVAMALQRHQFLVIAAQMRGAVEDVGDEGRLAERKRIECGHELNLTRSCGGAR